MTPTYRSTRGKHRLYRSDERLRSIGRAVVNYTNGSGAKLGIRIGANGMAAQSIIPPSPGREWEVSWDEVEPADAAGCWLYVASWRRRIRKVRSVNFAEQ